MREESHPLFRLCIAETNYTGFSSQLNELIADQGELAVVIEESDDQYEITGYCLPSQKDSFDMDEIRNISIWRNLYIIQFIKTRTGRSCLSIWI